MDKSESPGLFGDAEVVATYSREQAIADGVLVDISSIANEAGFKVPVALTAAVRARLEPSDRAARLGQSVKGRLWDVLMVLRSCAGDRDTVSFDVLLAEMDEQHTVHLKAVIGPGDHAEPVITIMFEHED